MGNFYLFCLFFYFTDYGSRDKFYAERGLNCNRVYCCRPTVLVLSSTVGQLTPRSRSFFGPICSFGEYNKKAYS